MFISVRCECGFPFDVAEEDVGTTVKCPICRRPLLVPSQPQEGSTRPGDEYRLVEEPAPAPAPVSPMPAAVAPKVAAATIPESMSASGRGFGVLRRVTFFALFGLAALAFLLEVTVPSMGLSSGRSTADLSLMFLVLETVIVGLAYKGNRVCLGILMGGAAISMLASVGSFVLLPFLTLAGKSWYYGGAVAALGMSGLFVAGLFHPQSLKMVWEKKGQAIGGTILGFCLSGFVSLASLPGIMALALPHAMSLNRPPDWCQENLKELYAGLESYAASHDGRLPESLLPLIRDNYVEPTVTFCPRVLGSLKKPWTGEDLQSAVYAYDGAGYLLKDYPASSLLCCDDLSYHDGKGANVLFGDGSVNWLSAEEYDRVLDHTEKWLKAHRLSGDARGAGEEEREEAD